MTVLVFQSPFADADDKPLAAFDGHAFGVTGVAFHPEGNRVVSVAFQDVRVWDRTTGQETADLKRGRGFTAAFRPDGKQVAVGGYELITIHDAVTGQQVSSFDPHGDWKRPFPFPPRVLALAYSQDGRSLATAASVAKVGGPHGYPGGVVKLFDAETGKLLREVGPFTSHAVAVTFSPDGKYLAAGSAGASSELPEAGELRVWDAKSFELLFSHKGSVPEVPGDNRWSASTTSFSPDGKRLASAGHDGIVRVWDVPSGKEVLTLRGHAHWVGRVTFDSKGEQILSAGSDGTARAWNATTGVQVGSIPFDAKQISALAISPDGRWFATGGGPFRGPGIARVWAVDFGSSGILGDRGELQFGQGVRPLRKWIF